MEYQKLGNSDLLVSSLCLGTMTFGDGADSAMCNTLYKASREKGINFFDCANVYAAGESERILGKLINGHRSEVVITTKAYYPTGDTKHSKGLSKEHLTTELEKSLKRINTDYIDVYYMHSFDKETPLNESLSVLNDFIKQGKIRYIGISNFAAWQIMKAIAINEKFNYGSIACIQPMYNLLKRQCESEILPMALSENLGVTPYSPLAGGLLTGKYQAKNNPLTGRFNTNAMYQKRYNGDENTKIVQQFLEFSNAQGYHPVSLAVAWVSANKAITAPIIGARNVAQLAPALDSLDLNISDNIYEELSKLSNTPAVATDRKEEQLW